MDRREFLGAAAAAGVASAMSAGCVALREEERDPKMSATQAPYILDDDPTIPIAGWSGPSGDNIRPDVMRLISEAGFNVSISKAAPGRTVEALDIAHAAGVRLILKCGFDRGRMSVEEGRDYRLTPEQKQHIRDEVTAVRGHPGLYGYYVADEPYYADYDWMAAVIREIESLDSYHMCYVNHWAPNVQGGLGAGSPEVFWKEWVRRTNPRFLSYDIYPIRRKPPHIEHEWDPYVFGDVLVGESYFSALEFMRWFGSLMELPVWAFTFSCSDPDSIWPIPTEGHIRFQLMCNLAYGARGLLYFKLMRNSALIRKDNGKPTATWEMARKVNTDIHALWRKMNGLRSIGVSHTGPVWPGTTLPMQTKTNFPWMDWRGAQFRCEGDPAVLGLFDDPGGNVYVLAVNKNPVERKRIRMLPGADDGIEHEWTTLAPGEGRLFRILQDDPPIPQPTGA